MLVSRHMKQWTRVMVILLQSIELTAHTAYGNSSESLHHFHSIALSISLRRSLIISNSLFATRSSRPRQTPTRYMISPQQRLSPHLVVAVRVIEHSLVVRPVLFTHVVKSRLTAPHFISTNSPLSATVHSAIEVPALFRSECSIGGMMNSATSLKSTAGALLATVA